MLELLITSLLLFSGGYGTRMYQEPTVEKFDAYVPDEYVNPIGIKDCVEKDGVICPIQAPRWIIPSEEYLKLSGYVKGIRMQLLDCNNDKVEFNNMLDSN